MDIYINKLKLNKKKKIMEDLEEPFINNNNNISYQKPTIQELK